MRNGPIYKQIEPEGGRGVGQGLYQSQRPSPSGQGALPKRVGAGGTWGLSEQWSCGPFLNSLTQECPAGFQVISGVSGEGQARLGGRGFFPVASLLLSERKCERPGQAPCKRPVSRLWAVVRPPPTPAASRAVLSPRVGTVPLCGSHYKDHSLTGPVRGTYWVVSQPGCPTEGGNLHGSARDVGGQRL